MRRASVVPSKINMRFEGGLCRGAAHLDELIDETGRAGGSVALCSRRVLGRAGARVVTLAAVG
ncbi:MAG: hypothetical protein KC636_26650 [Myxococcales bacterium]|nr:hypothetical protein [Myxococcales bacterium]